MASGNNILLNDITAKGVYMEGIIEGTPKPGTVMQIKAATEPIGGRPTWVPYNRDADGNRPQGPLIVLLPDHLQGKIATDAYVTGARGFGYVPQAGEELNMLVANQAGTADAFAIGDLLMVDDTTDNGMLIATSSPETEPFMVMETVAAITEDTLVHCIHTGY